MKNLLFILTLSFSLNGWAQNDVCCVLAKVTGNNVSTFTDFKSSLECKGGATLDEKKVCSSLSTDHPTCTDRGKDAQQKRCSVCGFVWVEGACVVKDLEAENEKLKKEKEALEKAKEKKEAAKTATVQSIPEQPSIPEPQP